MCVLVVAVIGCVIFAVWTAASSPGVEEWIAGMKDPTERGCAYIAVAIGIHAFFSLVSDRKVEVEVKDRRP